MANGVAKQLERRTSESDVGALLRAAEDEALPMRAAAIVALGKQHRQEVLPIVRELRLDAPRDEAGACRVAL
jgi:hypothetical protein